MKRRVIGTMLTAALVAGSMVPAATCMAEEEKPYDGVTLSLMIETGTAPETYEPMVELIQEKMGITINVEMRPAGSEGTNLIRTRLASGDMTDLQIYNVGSLLATLNPAEYFIDMAGTDVAATFDASFTEAASVDGGLYAVPAGSSSGGGVMYNKDIYEEYNLEVPETWDEFIANLDVLKEAGETALIGSFADAWTAQVPSWLTIIRCFMTILILQKALQQAKRNLPPLRLHSEAGKSWRQLSRIIMKIILQPLMTMRAICWQTERARTTL